MKFLMIHLVRQSFSHSFIHTSIYVYSSAFHNSLLFEFMPRLISSFWLWVRFIAHVHSQLATFTTDQNKRIDWNELIFVLIICWSDILTSHTFNSFKIVKLTMNAFGSGIILLNMFDYYRTKICVCFSWCATA